ncbi:MAG: type II secretion system F family protein [Planctomycetia bacterium]|nr:type II secretion system F family protein [Planctomycetia bacterium]
MPLLLAFDLLPAVGSLLIGGGVFFACWWIARALATKDLEHGAEWRYDVSRINELRRHDVWFRVFQPLIRFLAKLNRVAFHDALPETQRQILAAGLSRFWLAEEYLARMQLFSLLLLPAYVFFCIRVMGAAGAIFGCVLAAVTFFLLRRRLAGQAQKRLVLIKRRMPYLLDLLTLLMEAGSTFLYAMRQSVEELSGHPVSAELGRVLVDMNLGKTRRQAFEGMRDRLSDDEVTGIIMAILQGEELGTPLARIFRTQADVLRIKRTQRAETIAGEAGVNMLLPGVLVMASTVLIIFGPFILNYLYSDIGL